MRDLIILGAGPHAQEMADIVRQINRVEPVWNLLGFIVPDAQAALVGRHMGSGLPVLGIYATIDQYSAAVFVPEYGCGFPDFPCERMVSLIAPSAFVASTAQIGAGCVIYPGCFVGHNAVLGKRVFCLSGCVINHDDRLEDNVTVCSNASLAGLVHVERDCYLGQGCAIRQELRIGRGSLIGMGSVIIRDVPPNSVMVGNPGRRLRDRTAGL